MNIKSLLSWGQKELTRFDSAKLDVELLLGELLQKDRVYLMAHDDAVVSSFELDGFRDLIKRRKTGLPMAYILGKKEFYGLEFRVNEHVLIPRPETEILVEAVISSIEEGELLVDVGTGSGCIPITILCHRPELRAVAVDISEEALQVAKENAKRHGVGERLQCFPSDLLKNLPLGLLEGKQFVVTANLPYVPLDHGVNEEAQFEPSLALYAKNEGLDLYQKLFDQLVPLKPRAIFVECYAFQVEPLAECLKNYRKAEVREMLGEARLLKMERV